jgi:hypothetical protein
MMGKFRLQSAMEYLMTYGWAILIIAVTLGALAFLGVFSGTGLLPTACIASSGYICNNPVYIHQTGGEGNLIVTIGQSTGTQWNTANVYFVPQSSEGSVASGTSLTSASYVGSNTNGGTGWTFPSGMQQSVTIQIPTSSGTTPPGTSLQGYLWVTYTTSSAGAAPLETEFATVTAKAS